MCITVHTLQQSEATESKIIEKIPVYISNVTSFSGAREVKCARVAHSSLSSKFDRCFTCSHPERKTNLTLDVQENLLIFHGVVAGNVGDYFLYTQQERRHGKREDSR